MRRVTLAQPDLSGNERAYVLDCLDSNWVSSIGKYINQFEDRFAQFCNVEHAIATNNGTTALHLAMVALDLQPGDEVLIPDLTYIATANAVRYCGATPVLVDSEPYTLNIDPGQIEAKITPRTKGVIAVHLYGHPADMTSISAIAKRHSLWVVEDAAEAHGAEVLGHRVGSLGTCATFSFYGNKIITTGEGGMITTNDSDLADRLRLLRGQGMDPHRRYWFNVVGFNYRMTNIQAAIGSAQMEQIEEWLRRRDQLALWYRAAFVDLAEEVELLEEQPWARQVWWMFNVYLRGADEHRRDAVMNALAQHGIETRPLFYPMHVLPPYREATQFPVASGWSVRGITLPTHHRVTEDDVQYIADTLRQVLKK